MAEIDDLCNHMNKSTKIFYDERKELEYYLNKQDIQIQDLKETDERYQRYLRGIDVWKRGKKNFEFIRDDIQVYLSLPSNSLNLKIKSKLMNKIDQDLMSVLLNKK